MKGKGFIKSTACILLCAMLLLSIFGCSGGRRRNPDSQATMPPDTKIVVEGNVKFTWEISSLVEEQAANAIMNAFVQKYPDTKVIPDFQAGNIAARISSGEIGDVFWFRGPETYNYAVTQKALLPLNQFIDPLDIDMSEVFTGILAIGQVDGQMYMVPRDYNHIVLMYNRTALREAGLPDPNSEEFKNQGMEWNWETFKKYCTATTKMNPNDPTKYMQIGGNMQLCWAPCYIPIFEGWGGKWVDTEDKWISMTNDKVLQGIDEVLSFAKTGALLKEGWDSGGAYTDINDLSYVFQAVCYPMVQPRAVAFDAAGIDWDFCDYPAFPNHVVGTGANGFGVYKYTKNPNAAAALALFMLSEEGQYAMHSNAGGSVPLVKKLAEQDFWRGHGSVSEVDWTQKNYEAFITHPEADINGETNCRAPIPVANVIGGYWPDVVSAYFNEGSYMDTLTFIETKANDTWQSILRHMDDIR